MSKRGEHITLLIQSMYYDLKNPRYDGWVQQQMLEDLVEIKKVILSLELEKERLRFEKADSNINNHIDDDI